MCTRRWERWGAARDTRWTVRIDSRRVRIRSGTESVPRPPPAWFRGCVESVRLHYVIALAWARRPLRRTATQAPASLAAQKQGPLAAAPPPTRIWLAAEQLPRSTQTLHSRCHRHVSTVVAACALDLSTTSPRRLAALSSCYRRLPPPN